MSNFQPNDHIEHSNAVSMSYNGATLRSKLQDSNNVSSNIYILSLSREQLIRDQEMDAKISCLAEGAVNEKEAMDNPKCYYKKCGVLMRKWHPDHLSLTF